MKLANSLFKHRRHNYMKLTPEKNVEYKRVSSRYVSRSLRPWVDHYEPWTVSGKREEFVLGEFALSKSGRR